MVAVLPTGYGKSLVFHVLPRLLNMLNERDAIALPRVQQVVRRVVLAQDLVPNSLHSQQYINL